MSLPQGHNWRKAPIVDYRMFEIVCADCDHSMWIAGKGVAETVMALDPYLDETTGAKL